VSRIIQFDKLHHYIGMLLMSEGASEVGAFLIQQSRPMTTRGYLANASSDSPADVRRGVDPKKSARRMGPSGRV
jgi:hypothetical protein